MAIVRERLGEKRLKPYCEFLVRCSFVKQKQKAMEIVSNIILFHFFFCCPGKRISLISKKNIRYEGVLYSINEQNATVALQNVRSYGTEGREQQEQNKDPITGAVVTTNFVPPNEAVHPYLLFRGQDIKDLHVHENQQDTVSTSATVTNSNSTTVPSNPDDSTKASTPSTALPERQPDSDAADALLTSTKAAEASASTTDATTSKPYIDSAPQQQQQQQERQTNSTQPPNLNSAVSRSGRGRGGGGRSSRQRKPTNTSQGAAVGTGASLLSRKERLAVSSTDSTTIDDFDFEQAANVENDSGGDVENNNATVTAYAKDDFFDSISCEALDKQSGIDNRLRGHQERRLNTETFGAVALNNNGRRRTGNGGNTNYGNNSARGSGRQSRGAGRYNGTNREMDGNRGNGIDGGVSSGRGRGRGRGVRGGRGGRGYGGRNGTSAASGAHQHATTAAES
jgi:protein LSM14